ncbi:glycoside hydrolase family 25 protein [Actinoallomurus purpureus]|uniref:glycoside hydrolase family 25 protein n=1 Tax=Actinoallomurus purpureus TaxID=478114 RepID=UPI002093A72C|nr:glycoside hydrolase family 25 protein [Actinoallomurus purpureus]MCO6006127.1 glycoside hydrolase family 25 protein [Actinoallomurus purpureus]
MLRGADISAWQGTPDLGSLAKRYGWSFVFIKATEGAAFSDSRFAADWAHAKAAGLVRGAYHFARPEQSPASVQADRLVGAARPGAGDLLCLDLERSALGQAETNAWAKAFAARLRQRAPGVTTVLYLGGSYAGNATGRGLADHFDLWWYPQYPGSGTTTNWPRSFSPWLPAGLTVGWKRPHIWQWTDAFAGEFDANVSRLTIEELAGVGGRQEGDMPYGGQLPAGKGGELEISFPRGFPRAIGLVYDNSLSIPELGVAPQPTGEVRIAVHRKDGTHQLIEAKVGMGTVDAHQPDKTFKTVEYFDHPEDVDYVVLIRRDEGTRPIGWDMS